MTMPVGYFALITDPTFGQPPGSGSPVGLGAPFNTDVILIIAAGFAVALVLMVWARYGRGRAGPDHTHASASGRDGNHRRRRRRIPHKRNPTRAETGGLPPIRADDASQSSP